MRAGRPRDAGVRREILVAAQELVLARGYAAVTTADVAERAGAGKQTIYRWWPSKGALVLDAFSEWVNQVPRNTRKRSLSSTVVEFCRAASHAAPALRALMAEAQFDDELLRRLVAQVVRPGGDELRAGLKDRRASDRELIVSVVSGLVWQRLMLNEPLDAGFVRFVVRVARRM